MKRLKRELKVIRGRLSKKNIVYRYKNRTSIRYFYCEDELSCLCTDGNGEFKKLYTSYKDALLTFKKILDESGLVLTIYQCPYTKGWHLSKG